MILAIVQSRYSSSRLPGKVLKKIRNKTLLEVLVSRLKESQLIDRIVVATSNCSEDLEIVSLCKEKNIECFRGELDDVLDRYYQCACLYRPQHVVRITGDCPLIDPQVVDQMIESHITIKTDYTSNGLEPTFPDGLDAEVIRFDVLKKIWEESFFPSDREHVTKYIYDHKDIFSLNSFKNLGRDYSHLRWTVDFPEDFEVVSYIIEKLYFNKPNFSWEEALKLYDEKESQNILKKNTKFQPNSGLQTSFLKDKQFKKKQQIKDEIGDRYKRSEGLLKKALSVIPLGSQTFSKSITQFPYGVSPYFLERGKGAYVWDVDGNKYLDLINGLASVSLGYCDDDIDNAVKEQLSKGINFSLATELEQKLAYKLKEHIPSAEMVRFGKNGTDATSGAIRIARAVTGKDHVLVCGYHGWQDWYIGSTTKNLGVPKVIQGLTHHFKYNDIDSLTQLFEQYKDNVAAVMMEPMNNQFPKDNFLENCLSVAHENGALFVFDETITGFRFSLGGAQKYFGVTPDLSTFGKGLGNGMPISALVGKEKYMRVVEDVFLSSTFGGEALSIAASLAVINKLERENGIDHISAIGSEIMEVINKIIIENELSEVISVTGHPSLSFLEIKGYFDYSCWEVKTFFIQECLKRGLLNLGTHNISFSYCLADVSYVEKIYKKVFFLLKKSLVNKTLIKDLQCIPIKPLFRVREL